MKARLAPTPSGFLHFGNAANFALNSLLAEGRDLLLRIDDLDRSRFRETYVEDIFRVIDWLGIRVTEGPTSLADFYSNWSQENRMPLYQAALKRLCNSPGVFACPCTRKELAGGGHVHGCKSGKIDLDASGVAWRLDTNVVAPLVSIPDLKTPDGFSVSITQSIPDFVIRKKNGTPSYQLACTVDDLHFGITLVGRGQDLLPSTAAQAILSELLEYPPLFSRINFVHHPLITGPAGSKLSKSAGARGISALLDVHTPEEVFDQAKAWLSL